MDSPGVINITLLLMNYYELADKTWVVIQKRIHLTLLRMIGDSLEYFIQEKAVR